MANLQKLYATEVKASLQQQYGYRSVMQIPRLEKIVLNMRVGEAISDKKHLVNAEKALALISAQKPVIALARKSVAGFKIRKGFPIGCKVTLRRSAMWTFLDRLIQIALPRVRDFRGLNPQSFDGFGNYNFGISEFTIFPEIDLETMDKMRGFDICVVTTAGQDMEARSLLTALGFPFKK